MEAILDTSFIISCIKRRIDFISNLEEIGFSPVLPREVLQELKDLKTKGSLDDRTAVKIALEMFSSKKIKKTKLGGRNTDEGIIERGKQGIYIATLDRTIKRSVPNRIVINNSKNSLLIERD